MDKRLKMGASLLQCTLNFTFQGQKVANVLYFQQRDFELGDDTGPLDWDDGAAAEQAATLANAWAGDLAPILSTDLVLESIATVWNENIDTGPLHEGIYTDAPLPAAGTLSASSVPSNVALAVKLATGLGGRDRHGRMFLCGITTDWASEPDSSQVQLTFRPGLLTALANFFSDCQFDTTDIGGTGRKSFMQVASFIKAGVLRAGAQATKVVALSLVDYVFDSQRRRLPGRGL